LTWLQFGIVTGFSVQMLTFDGHWHAGEVCFSQINPSFNCAREMPDPYGVVWASSLLMSEWWTECPMVATVYSQCHDSCKDQNGSDETCGGWQNQASFSHRGERGSCWMVDHSHPVVNYKRETLLPSQNCNVQMRIMEQYF
jgi:hypothetical protein